MFRGRVTLGFVVLVAVGVPIATADTVVERKVAAEKGDDGAITADIQVINTGPSAVTLAPVVLPSVAGCLPTTDPGSVAAAQSTTVKVTLPQACFADDSSPVAVDLDGVGRRTQLPATVVTPPKDDPSNWAPMWWGLFVGVLMALTVALRGLTEHRKAKQKATAPSGTTTGPSRETKYAAVQAIVEVRMQSLPDTAVEWRDLDPAAYDLTSPIGNLEAGWSFKDSWVSNITVAATALIALLTSADALTAVLGDKPSAALGVMTVAGLVSAALIGIANTVVKLVGESVTEVTVGGLILSTSIVVLAAGFQVVTVGLAVAGAVDGWALAGATVLLATAVAAILEVFAFRSLGQTIRQGFADALPEVPATALTDWAATEPWEQRIVAADIRATYAKWLVLDLAQPVAYAVPGTDGWAAVARAPAPERRRSLL